MSNCGQCAVMKIVPVAAGAALVLYIVYRKMYKGGCCGGKKDSCCINRKVSKTNDGVVKDVVNVSELEETSAFCRCWKSDKFPYCDGSHNKHNKETGDNVGPLVIKKTA